MVDSASASPMGALIAPVNTPVRTLIAVRAHALAVTLAVGE
jgi:hypothetical protein